MVSEPPKGYRRIVRIFEASELVLYSAVAVFLIVIAIISLLDELLSIGNYLTASSTILGLEELFVTIIVLELLMTVIGYMKTRSINLGLLLGVGLTAMIRKIITVGYSSTNNQEFALVLVATAILVAAIIFVGNRTIKA
ncbi:MAG TPA: phosphate-starvation-inducible PsiE family protein [archaeon]